MPLKNGYSRKTFNDNYRTMRDEGHPHDQALAACYKNARNSFFRAHPDGALPGWLIPKDGRRLKNPVPPSSRADVKRRVFGDAENARLLYEKFTGHDGADSVVIDKPLIPDVMCVIGDIDGIMYTTMRDGKTEKYLHKFKKSARPLFCVSPDGLSLHLIGGSYQFGERGIEDF